MNAFLHWLEQLPPFVVYLFIGIGSGVENIFPPVPADTFVLLGAFLSVSGRTSTWAVFVVSWLANVATATLVYLLARKHGRAFFQTPIGHWLLHPKQIEQIGGFYNRWGTPAIFVSRFLPGFRAVVPVFAGVTHVPLSRLLLPLVTASACWHAVLVLVGASAGKEWEEIVAFVDRFSHVLLIIAGVLLTAVAAWWWKTHRAHHS